MKQHLKYTRVSFTGIIFLATVLFCGCKNFSNKEIPLNEKNDSTKFNGVYKSYRDGYLYSEVTLKDGKKEGLAKKFYKNGRINTEVYYKNNIKIDTSRWYYTDGKIYRETPYQSGAVHGIQKKYHRNGLLKAEIPFVYGKRKVGLKEYSIYNNPVKSYPTISYNISDKRAENRQVILTVRLSNNSQNVKFYQGELEKGIFDTDKIKYILTEKGKGSIAFVEKPDFAGRNQINIIGYYKTKNGNYKILQKRIPLPSSHLKE